MEANAHPQTKMERLINESEFNRFGLICIILIVIGCLGGIAVGLGAVQSTLALTALVLPTMATLSLLLAVAPMRYILTSATICFAIDIILIAFYALT